MNPFEGQLMAQQSHISKLEGDLQAALAMIQSLPSRKEVQDLQEANGIMKAHIGGLTDRCTSLEDKLAQANLRHFKLAQTMHRATGIMMGSLDAMQQGVSACHWELQEMVEGGFDPRL